MERLGRRDFRALSEFLHEIYTVRPLTDFPRIVVDRLPQLISVDLATFHAVDLRDRQSTVVVTNPPRAYERRHVQAFDLYMHEHPVLAYYRRTGSVHARKIGDFLSRQEIHRLDLYNEVYRPLGLEWDLITQIPVSPSTVAGLTLRRRQRDFSERDREVVDLLQPHALHAYRNAEAITRLQQMLALVRDAVDELDHGLVILRLDGRIELTNLRARDWLTQYFGPRRAQDTLPDPLLRWIKRQGAPSASPDDAPIPRAPLVLDRGGKRLVIRLVTGPAQRLLLLEERPIRLDHGSAQRLGLTRREAEVLSWVAQAKSNGDIASILGLSPRTVAKHVEMIFQKLGVENRTAAAAKAWPALQRIEAIGTAPR